MMKTFRTILPVTIAICLSVASLHVFAAPHAAKVIYAFGQVQATGSSKARNLRKGDQVFPGETVSTARGRAQIQFTDGGFASLQPNTEYRIDDYNYAGSNDGNERSFLSLIKGSVRLVTGAIGKTNRNRFRLKTKLATIGIRGTTGKVSHCDSNCGNLPTGTSMQGYGGTWDLVSGAFSGAVAAGDAYVCDGSSCTQIEGGVQQREDVGEFEGEEEEDETYVQGMQVDDEGIICDLGGNCGGDVVLLDQMVATAFQGSPGDTFAADDSVLILSGGVPTTLITFTDGVEDADVEITTVDVDIINAALALFPDAEITATGDMIISAIDSETLSILSSMPASIAPEDFGTTSDGVLIKGRLQNGYALDISVYLDPFSVETDLFELSGLQSKHLIFGPDPGTPPTGGTAVYNFTGGTYSTATDGSSIGMGATDGSLSWDFGAGSGGLDMTVVHDSVTYDISGTLLGDGPRIFYEDTVLASSGGSSYPVTLDGFFAGANDGGAPLAAGLGYVIDKFFSAGYDIIGVAGFGLNSFTAAPTVTSSPAPIGTYVAASHAFIDTGTVTNSNGWDFVVNGSSEVATLLGSSVDSFTTTTHPGICVPSCTFNAGSAVQVESGSNPTVGASWVRWGVGHSFSHAFVSSELGHGHIIQATTPTMALPAIGSGSYTVLMGGTTPTLNRGPGGGTFEIATGPGTHSISVLFMTGDITASHTIPFPSTTVSVFGSVTGGALGVLNAINYTGDLIGGPDACTACVFGHDHFTFVGSNAEYVVGSGQFNTSGVSPDEYAGAFTFILQDPAR